MHVPQLRDGGADPPLADRPLEDANAAIEGAWSKARAYQADLGALEERQGEARLLRGRGVGAAGLHRGGAS
jgi:hypothetical protein